MPQLEQPQPQEDFPCFLFFTIRTTIVITTAISTAQMTIVDILFKSHDII
jgi:hypothetical protein